jgi:hypothetical protein
VKIFVEDGRGRAPDACAYDVIQASLVDLGRHRRRGDTLTENTLYTVEAFDDYLDHLTDDGVLTITRWVFDGVRLISLAQAACEARGWSAADRIAVVRHERVATFLLKRSPFTPDEITRLRDVAARLKFDVLYAPGVQRPAATDPPPEEWVDGTRRPTTRGSRSRPTATRSIGHTRTTSVRRPTTGRSISTRRSSRISSPWRSAGRCCSATG